MHNRLTGAQLAILRRVRAEGLVCVATASDPDGELFESLAETGFVRGVRTATDARTFVLSGAGLRAAAPIPR